jgi:hypothetical protein
MKTIPVVMKPMEVWGVGEAHDSTPAIQFWDRAYDRIPSLELRRSHASVDVSALRTECATYQSRIFARNSKKWMKLLSVLPFLNLFKPVHIRLTDLGKTVRFSFFDELQEVQETRAPDIEMACDSLSFIFANEFGFDTLLVNARCNADKRGLDLVLKNFAIGNANAMGWSVGWGMFGLLVHEARLIWLVLRELRNVNPE